MSTLKGTLGQRVPGRVPGNMIGAEEGWSPAQLPGAVLSLVADGANTLIGPVSRVASELGPPLIQSTTAAMPAYSANFSGSGYAALSFDGVDDGMITGSPITLGSFTIACVLKIASPQGFNLCEQGSNVNSTDGAALPANTAELVVKRGASTGTLTAGAAWIPNNTPCIVVVAYDGTMAETVIRVNGAAISYTTSGAAAPGAGLVTDFLNVFARNNAASAWGIGLLAALSASSQTLALADIQTLERWYGARYAITVP